MLAYKSPAWHSQTRLKIRSLRDCCQNWSSFYDIAIHGLNNQAGDLYASKYYDESSTGYYLDPGNTSISLNVAGNIETQGALKAWLYDKLCFTCNIKSCVSVALALCVLNCTSPLLGA